jgi:hypothetical protein
MTAGPERRDWLRLDKVFPVLVESPHFGYMNCIARNISCGGLFLETRTPLPLGCPIRVYFAAPGKTAGISAVGQVKNHYFLNYAAGGTRAAMTGMGVRFTEFDDDGEDQLRQSIRDVHVLH